MVKRVLVIDNYDSFTWNLVHLLEALGAEVEVIYNTHHQLPDIKGFTHIVISPGPGLPHESNNLKSLMDAIPATMPVLGVCLGHQALAAFSGSPLTQLSTVFHGVDTQLITTGDAPLFRHIQGPIRVGLYHSWCVDPSALHPDWIPDATSQEGILMGMHHRTLPRFGVQFHPESVMTTHGRMMLQNFLDQ